jgi:ankyrin repeat protein
MYHSHKATVQHDKVYALLGMSSDATNEMSLSPNYDLPWTDLFGILIKFLLHADIFVEPSPTEEATSIKGAVCILGFIHSVTSKQATEVKWRNVSGTTEDSELPINFWTPRPSAKPLTKGDIVCLFPGATHPTIIRIHGLQWIIVQIAPTPPIQVKSVEGYMDWSEFEQRARLLPTQSIHCVWHWGPLPQTLEPDEPVEVGMVTGLWNSMLILLGARLDEAERLFQSLMRAYDIFEEEKFREAISDALHDTSDIDYRRLKWYFKDAPLSWASGKGLMDVVDLLIRKDKNAIGFAHRMQYAPLTRAAENGDLRMVERLLQEKPTIDRLDVTEKQSGLPSRTALQIAAENGHLEIVERLLEEKVNVDSAAEEYYGRTALQAACGGGHIEIMEKLLEAKADVNAPGARDHGRTALQAAAERGYLPIVERLLQAGAHVNARTALFGGITAVQAAAQLGHIAMVERLLKEKDYIDSARSIDEERLLDTRAHTRALHFAVYGGHLAVLIRLIQEEVDKIEWNCSQIAEYIIQTEQWAIMELLLEAHSDVHAVGALDQDSPLVTAEGPRLDIVKQPQQAEPVTNTEDDSRIIALRNAKDKGYTVIVELLRQAVAVQSKPQ